MHRAGHERSQHERFGPLDTCIYLATQILTATSLFTQGQAHHYVILKLGTLTLLMVWMGDTTQSIDHSKVMEASHASQHRQLKNNPGVVFLQKEMAFFPPVTDRSEDTQLFPTLGNIRRDFTSLQCRPAPTDGSRRSSILTEHLYRESAKLFWPKSPKKGFGLCFQHFEQSGGTMKNEFCCLRTKNLLSYWFWSFAKIKEWQQTEAPV